MVDAKLFRICRRVCSVLEGMGESSGEAAERV
jgi:hypothetical protein